MKNRRYLSHNLVFLLINLAIAFIILFRTAYNASDLEIVPDSVEYTVTASRLVTDQSYTIVMDGQSWPPRYPPWFSMLVIAPAYLLLGDEPGNAVFPLTNEDMKVVTSIRHRFRLIRCSDYLFRIDWKAVKSSSS